MEPESSLSRLQVPATWPYSEPDKSSPYPLHPTSWRFIFLIVSSHLRPGLPSDLLPSDLPTKTVALRLSSMRATCSAHLILLDFTTQIIFDEEYRSLSSSLCSFLHSPTTSSLLGPNILLNTLLSNTLGLRSSLSVSDHIFSYTWL